VDQMVAAAYDGLAEAMAEVLTGAGASQRCGTRWLAATGAAKWRGYGVGPYHGVDGQ
jgi:hypothetical protein